MDILKFNTKKLCGEFKPLNATNGGPWHKRHATDQWRTNFESYKAARIPYSRNHDSNACGSIYGGPFAHDISAIFPNFNADPYSPESYDFTCTDECLLTTLEAGTKIFYRLGQTIEHQIKKHDTLPPPDFKKWAVICEHIIRHFNYGWANGLHLGIEYWEIWNEADLDEDDSPNKRTWGGTKAQFFELYETTATHLKACFPELKIGGPALAWRESWAEDFLKEMSLKSVPLDFFSWHIYCTEPKALTEKAERMRALCDKYGYTRAENILNEWNYVKGWTSEYLYSIKTINSIKGAAFTMACISASQDSPLDMLMYYDTRPSCFCGVFDYYTYEPLKGYYPLYWYGMLYDTIGEIKCETPTEHIYTLCGMYENGKLISIITHYTDEDEAPAKTVKIDLGKTGNYEIYLLDSTHNGELIKATDDLTLTLEANTCVLIKEI